LNTIDIRVTFGAIAFSNSTHFPAMDDSMLMKPVALPPGRASPSTKRSPTGSETETKTMGMVRVSRSSARTTGVVAAKIALGCDLTSSAE